MPATTYTYSVSGDTANGVVASDSLHQTIHNSAIVIALEGVSVQLDVLKIEFKDALSAGDKTILDGLVAVHNGVALPDQVKTVTGVPIVAITSLVTSGSTPTIITPNWCDKCTWYYTSTRVTGETLTDSGNLTTWNSAHTFWIDMTHGRLTQEHSVNGADRSVKVYVNGVLKTEHPPGTTSGDYGVNYEAGTVTFGSALISGDVVTADYNYAVDSMWKLVPPAGKMFSLRTVEVQFSTDIELTDTVTFAPHGPIDVFAPQLLQSNGGPYPPGTMIPLQTNKYLRMHNYIDEAQEAYPEIPMLGGVGWRGMQNPIHIFRWPYTDSYGAVVDIKSSVGMELRIWLESHTPFNGERAVATLYARLETES